MKYDDPFNLNLALEDSLLDDLRQRGDEVSLKAAARIERAEQDYSTLLARWRELCAEIKKGVSNV